MSYNIRYDNPDDGPDNWNHRKKEMVHFIDSIDATVFGIQEGLPAQVDYLNQELEHYQYIGVGRDDGKHRGEYCAVFFQPQKIHLLDSSTFWLSDTPGTVSVGWDAALPRICTYGLFEDNDQNKFYVFNTHFDHKGEQARKQSAALIIEQIKTINKAEYPVILMGDFNATPDEPPIVVITRYLQDPFSQTAPTGTFNGFKEIQQNRRIDFIFTRNFKVASYKHADPRRKQGRFLSDHLPVVIQANIFKASH